MLQGRIVAERARDDEGGGLHEQLVALDYRRWHRFRIERWQDGGWRKLSGPASAASGRSASRYRCSQRSRRASAIPAARTPTPRG